MELIRIILFSILCTNQTSYSAIKTQRGDNYQKLRTKLQRQAKKVAQLRQQMAELEASLVSQNKQYIDGVNRAEQLDLSLQQIQGHLQGIQNEMTMAREKMATILKNYMARSLDNDPNDHDLYLDRVMVKGVLKKRERYNQLKQDFFSLKSEADILAQKIADHRDNEQQLRALITDLENDKERITKDFFDHKEHLRQLKARVKKQGHQTRKASPVSTLKMNSPLRSFISMKKDKNRKGVLYRFQGKSPFYSSYQGRVQYLGRLANYGNLIIINHGRDIRSILLGDIIPKVKKGQQVGQGEFIGYTKFKQGRRGKLYFEVRVKNLAHNTLSWIDRDSFKLSKVRSI